MKITMQFTIGLLAAGIFFGTAAWVWNWSLAFNVVYHDIGTMVALILVGGVMFGVGVALMVSGAAQKLFLSHEQL